MLGERCFSCFHGSTRDKDHGYIEAHGGIEHAGGDFVAIRNADHGISAVSVNHVLNGVCDDVSGGQAVEHAVMAHCNAVIDRDRIKFFGDATGVFNLASYQLSEIF